MEILLSFKETSPRNVKRRVTYNFPRQDNKGETFIFERMKISKKKAVINSVIFL